MNALGGTVQILASSASPTQVQNTGTGSGTEVTLPCDSAAITRWTSLAPQDVQLGLLLEQIQGTHDATVLHISIRQGPPEAPSAVAQKEILLTSAALYGLRHASTAGQTPPGLTLHQDITAHADVLRPQLLNIATPLTLVIRTRPGLPVGATIQIARLSIVFHALK